MSGGDLRVRVFAADGTAVTTPAPPQESATATGNLTDFAELRYRGSGVEDEQSVMLFFDDDAGDVTELRTEVLAFGPGYRVEVETKFFYLGPDDRFYVTEQEAKAAGGSGEAVMAGMIERVSSVMRAHPHEAGRVDPARCSTRSSEWRRSPIGYPVRTAVARSCRCPSSWPANG